jgi:hypothetical protein
MTAEDLKKFCAQPPRLQLVEPFSDDLYTYASNGALCVRVTRIESIPVGGMSQTAGTLFRDHFPERTADFAPLPEFPVESQGNAMLQIGEQLFAVAQLALIAGLPGVRFMPGKGMRLAPAAFVFDGGCGLIAPLRKEN